MSVGFAAADNPFFRRALRLHRPEAALRSAALRLMSGIAIAVVLGSGLSNLPYRLDFDDFVLMVAAPAFLLHTMEHYFQMRAYFASQAPVELEATPADPARIVAGLHAASAARSLLPLVPIVLLLPNIETAFERTPPLRQALFASAALLIFEGTCRAAFCLPLIVRDLGVRLLAAMLALAAVGTSMAMGAAAAATAREGAVLIPVLQAGVIALFAWLFTAATWRPWTALAGKWYRRRVRLLLEGDERVVDAPSPGTYIEG